MWLNNPTMPSTIEWKYLSPRDGQNCVDDIKDGWQNNLNKPLIIVVLYAGHLVTESLRLFLTTIFYDMTDHIRIIVFVSCA